MPPATRAALPPHPRRPWLTVFGSVRFFLALFRWALRDAPDDPREILALKRKMRWSAFREAVVRARVRDRAGDARQGGVAPSLAVSCSGGAPDTHRSCDAFQSRWWPWWLVGALGTMIGCASGDTVTTGTGGSVRREAADRRAPAERPAPAARRARAASTGHRRDARHGRRDRHGRRRRHRRRHRHGRDAEHRRHDRAPPARRALAGRRAPAGRPARAGRRARAGRPARAGRTGTAGRPAPRDAAASASRPAAAPAPARRSPKAVACTATDPQLCYKHLRSGQHRGQVRDLQATRRVCRDVGLHLRPQHELLLLQDSDPAGRDAVPRRPRRPARPAPSSIAAWCCNVGTGCTSTRRAQ